MNKFEFEPHVRVGTRFEVHGAEMELCFCDDQTVRFAACIGGAQSTMALERLVARLKSGEWPITFTPPAADGERRSASMLSDKGIKASNRRRTYLTQVRSKLGVSWPKATLRAEIQRIAQELGDENPPSEATVRRWQAHSLRVGSTTTALALDQHKKGTYARFSDEAEMAMNQLLQKWYCTDERHSIKYVRTQLIADIAAREELEELFPIVPSLRTLERRADQLDGFEKVATRYGLRRAQKLFRASGRSECTDRILQLVQADGHIMDVLVGPDKEPAADAFFGGLGQYRPYITILLDVHSRAVLSVVLTAAPFSTDTVLQALKRAVVADGGRPKGLPETLSIDNGSDYISDGLKRAAFRFGIELLYSQPYRPDGKAIVERFIQELARFVHTLPGSVFSSPQQRGDYDSAAEACLSLSELQRLIDEFVETYNLTLHGTIQRVPTEAWRDSAAVHPPRQVDAAEADAVARAPYRRVAVEGRVTVQDLQWFSQGLTTYEQSERHKGRTPWVDVLIDESNLATVLVQPIGGQQIFMAESTKPGYANDLTMYEHKEIAAAHRAAGQKDLIKVGEKELAQRKAKLRQDVRELRRQSKKAARKAARLDETARKNASHTSVVPEKIVSFENLPETVAAPEPPRATRPAPPPIMLAELALLPDAAPAAVQTPAATPVPAASSIQPEAQARMEQLLAQPPQIFITPALPQPSQEKPTPTTEPLPAQSFLMPSMPFMNRR